MIYTCTVRFEGEAEIEIDALSPESAKSAAFETFSTFDIDDVLIVDVDVEDTE